MGKLIIQANVGKTDATLNRDYQRPTSAAHAATQAVADLVQGIVSGNQLASSDGPVSVAVSVEGAAVRASGTVTVATAIAGNTVTINGVVFTGVGSGATGNQFNIGGSNTITATNIANAINGSVTALVAGHVTASSSAAVVTIRSTNYGIYGNAVTLASSGATLTVSGARLSGGAADANAKTYSF